jgi:hypothetical protein
LEAAEIINTESFSARLKKLAGLAFVLALVTVVIRVFRIEYLGSFDTYFPFVAGAVFLHNLTPFKLRKYLFSSWTLIILSLTAGIIFSLAAFAIILLAVAITFIPQKTARNSTAAVLFAGMIAARIIFRNHGALNTMIALAGIFIMLRFIFLLYEISFIKTKPSFLERVNYLFMLPNIFFPLFPIVDPLVFFKQKESDTNEAIALGKMWLVRGILHLLFYRFIYLYVSPSIYELHSWRDLLIFVLSGYSLILRLSGIFYLSGGIIALMGYKLPPLFENYFLVRNFRDLWRRINLYWRHFMWRVFYYPMLFRLKKWPQKRAVLFTVMIMFGVTWLLHGWQWYWVKGFFPLLPNDILYWAIFGCILAYVSVRAFSEIKSNATPGPFARGIGIISMFFAMSLLWSLWTASSLTEWLYIISKFTKLNAKEIAYLILAVIGIFLTGGIISLIQSKTNLFSFFIKESNKKTRLAILIVLAATGIFYRLGDNLFSMPLAKMVDPQLNMTDRIIVERGYYEQLLTTSKMTREMQPVFRKTEINDFQNDAYENTDGLLPRILKPDFHTTFKGKMFTTNSLRMRDKNYPEQRSPGVYRIALLGGSYEMGSGVADGEPYEQVIEDSLNKINIPCEILNLGVGGYHVFQMLKIAQLQCNSNAPPDAMIYVCHSSEKQRMINNILGLVNAGKDLEFEFLRTIVKRSGIVPGKMCQVEMYDRLYPYSDTLLKYAYHEFSAMCVSKNIKPVWVYLPAIGDLREDCDLQECLSIAKNEGLEIINLGGIFSGKDIHRITVSDEDTHPNKAGHQIIANALFPGIKKIIAKHTSMSYLPLSNIHGF